MVRPLPNGWRLSCGAELEGSQTEFYNSEDGRGTGAAEDGRRQLQALVRLRAKSYSSYSSGPSSPRARGALTERHLATGVVTPTGPLLRTHQARRAPHTTGPSSWLAP